MAKKRKGAKGLGTIWEISDELWDRIRPILEEFWPKKRTGRKLANWRLALNGIIFRMRTGCQWDQLPKRFGPKSTVHDWFQRWNKNGVMAKIMAALIAECEELGGVHWDWQSADGAMAKARFGGIKSAATPQIAEKMAPNAA
jgi:putative transposase